MVIELGGYQFDISFRALVVGSIEHSFSSQIGSIVDPQNFLLWEKSCMEQAENYVDEGADILELSLVNIYLSYESLETINVFLRSVEKKFSLPVFLLVDPLAQFSDFTALDVEVIYAQPADTSLTDICEIDKKKTLPQNLSERLLLSSVNSEISDAEMVALQTKHIVDNGRIIRTNRVRLSRRVADLTSAILQAKK